MERHVIAETYMIGGEIHVISRDIYDWWRHMFGGKVESSPAGSSGPKQEIGVLLLLTPIKTAKGTRKGFS